MAALPTMANDMRKLSFAKVAAASAKNPGSITAIARSPATVPVPAQTSPVIPRERAEQNLIAASAMLAAAVPAGTSAGPVNGSLMTAEHASPGVQASENKIVEGLNGLKLETQTPNLIVNGSLSSATERSSKAGNSQTPSDDNSQRADSSSDLGTKPPSLDGKSITSGTTFALDEKESLRPDDSASVKAAAEDDDSFSIRGSYIASSRVGSEVAARIHRIQIGDMPPRAITTHVLPGTHSHGVATPLSGASEKQPGVEVKIPLVTGTAAPDSLAVNDGLSKNPDEKLLEAMSSVKDRLFLLRLEQQVIEFVQDSKEPFMDLPPSNSFCRMLTHKLADYYHMTHSFEAVAGAVRIYRTPFCRIPPSLSSIAAAGASNSSSPAPAILPRKIMRRGEEGEFGNASASPSKATSEAGSDKEKGAPAKEKLTREEREEAYNRARQRIFGNSEKTEASTPDGEDSNGMSRASSVSAKDRANLNGKRKTTKQRRDDSESFESRSQYVAWCGPQQPTWAQAAPQYFPANSSPFNGQFHQTYSNAIQPGYAPNQSFPQMVPGNPFPPYNGAATYPPPPVPQVAPPLPVPPPQQQPQQQQRYQTPNPPPLAAPYGSPVAQPAWTQPSIPQGPYPPRTGSASSTGIPYAYGQLPANINPQDPKSQHPIPGSYNRQAFNPKTQSFVPGNGMVTMQPPAPPYGTSSPHHGSPQFNPSHMNYTGYQQPPLQPLPPQSSGYGPGQAVSYGMTRQGSNNSMAQYHPMPQQSLHAPQHMPHNPPVIHTHIPSINKAVVGPPGASVQQQTFSHLPNYGNPATLPQKPST